VNKIVFFQSMLIFSGITVPMRLDWFQPVLALIHSIQRTFSFCSLPKAVVLRPIKKSHPLPALLILPLLPVSRKGGGGRGECGWDGDVIDPKAGNFFSAG
jgi:hypothetical protein